jgi:hypothetical protein
VDTFDGAGTGAGHVPGFSPGFVHVSGSAPGSALASGSGSRHHAKAIFDKEPHLDLKRPKMRNTAGFGSAGENLAALEAF